MTDFQNFQVIAHLSSELPVFFVAVQVIACEQFVRCLPRPLLLKTEQNLIQGLQFPKMPRHDLESETKTMGCKDKNKTET